MKKYMNINNEINYKKFIKRLYIYRSLLYFNTTFICNNDYKDVKYIVHALNIKSRRKKIKYIYDTSCMMINNRNKNINICGFINNKCFVQRKNNSNNCNGCCRLCIYQSSNGCTTSNLACKLFNCSEVKKRFEVYKFNDINLLKLLSLKNRIIVKNDYFSKREDVLRDLYCIGIIIPCIRLIYRLVRNYIYYLKNNFE